MEPLGLPKPGVFFTVPPDMRPGETRWQCLAAAGPELRRADGSRYLPVKMIGWVRGRAPTRPTNQGE